MVSEQQQQPEDVVTDVVHVEYDAVVIKCTRCDRAPVEVRDPRALQAFMNGAPLAAQCNQCGHRMLMHRRRLLG